MAATDSRDRKRKYAYLKWLEGSLSYIRQTIWDQASAPPTYVVPEAELGT